MVRNFGRGYARSARPERKRKAARRCYERRAAAAAVYRSTKYIAETGTRSPERARWRRRISRREKRRERSERKRTKIMENEASAVIASVGLNGGISRYLRHNFTGFTMAYIRGPAERISPRGTHICPTETFVIPRLRPAR